MIGKATEGLSDDALERELTAALERAAGGGGGLLTTAPLATATNSSKSYWNKKRLTNDGPPFIRIGRSVRYAPAEVARWLVARRRRSTSEGGPRAA